METIEIKSDYRKALEILKPFCKKNIGLANFQFVTTFIFLWSTLLLSYFVYDEGWYFSLILFPIITILMCRSYVIEHDCGHQSFYRKKSTNAIIGNIMAFPIMIPYSMWKYIHNSHHNHVGNLDKRDINPEMWTMTVKEYENSSAFKKIAYQFIRSKFSRFVFAPVAIFGIIFRFPNRKFDRMSNIAVIIYDILYFLTFWFITDYISFEKLLFIYFIPLVGFFMIASYVFYAQHQFEDTYWENNENWTYEEATFKGSTFLSAPRWFNWVSGNVVYHNIHHLISTIPNYNLEKAQLALGNSLEFKPISIFKVYSLLELKLWDEEKKKLVGFNEIIAKTS